MKNKLMEKIIKNQIREHVINTLHTQYNKRDIFVASNRIELFGAHVSSIQNIEKLQFRVHDVLLFADDTAYIFQVYGQITEHGDIIDVEVERQKRISKGAVYA